MDSLSDFEARARSTSRQTYVLAAAVYGFALWRLSVAYGGLFGLLLTSPLLAGYFAWWVLHRGSGGLRWFKWLALRKVNGTYTAFDDLPVQVAWSEGQCCVSALDAFRVIGEIADDTVFRRLAIRFGEAQFFTDANGQWWFGESAILQWLETRAQRLDAVAMKFQTWLRGEVFAPMHRKAQLASSDPTATSTLPEPP